jgi:hypothetical protein
MSKQFIAATLAVALIALTTAGTNWANAQDGGERDLLERLDPDMDASSGLKQALKLSADQEKLWAPVEEALTNLREQRRAYRSAMMASEQSDHSNGSVAAPR